MDFVCIVLFAGITSASYSFGDAYTVLYVPYDGDCMFTSLGLALGLDQPEAAKQVRRDIVAYMKENPHLVSAWACIYFSACIAYIFHLTGNCAVDAMTLVYVKKWCQFVWLLLNGTSRDIKTI